MIENIVAGVIATIICSVLFKLMEDFKTRVKDESNIKTKNEGTSLKEISIVRKQFFACLIYIFIVVIGLIFNLFRYELLLTFISITTIFAFIILWGAFDVIFNPLKSQLQKTEDDLSNDDSDSH